jgi:hypothetical protein
MTIPGGPHGSPLQPGDMTLPLKHAPAEPVSTARLHDI